MRRDSLTVQVLNLQDLPAVRQSERWLREFWKKSFIWKKKKISLLQEKESWIQTPVSYTHLSRSCNPVVKRWTSYYWFCTGFWIYGKESKRYQWMLCSTCIYRTWSTTLGLSLIHILSLWPESRRQNWYLKKWRLHSRTVRSWEFYRLHWSGYTLHYSKERRSYSHMRYPDVSECHCCWRWWSQERLEHWFRCSLRRFM